MNLENAERHEDLTIVRTSDTTAHVYRSVRPAPRRKWNTDPVGLKTVAHYSFRSRERRDQWIEEFKAARSKQLAAAAASKVARAADDKARAEAMRERIQVGTILHYSWGYEQTNCDFFQVVARRGAKAVVRRIGSAVDMSRSEGGSSMTEYLLPVRDHFVGPEIVKVIGPFGIRMDFGTADPVEEGRSYFHSWYG